MPHTVSHGIASRLKPKWEDAHPWLLAATVIVSLGAQNVEWFTLGDVLAVLGPALLAATITFGALLLIRRSARHAALLSSWIGLLGLYYGTLFDGLQKLPAGGGDALRHGVLIAIGAGVAAILWHLSGELKSLAKFLSLTAAITLTAFSVKLALALAREPSPTPSELATTTPAQTQAATEGVSSPDIYYLILDGYARGDVLQKSYDFDNSEFLDGLRQRGFYVADKSCTNYPGTAFSLSSSLNMRFHQSFNPQGSYKPFARMVRTHEVGRRLSERGYQLIHFNTSFVPTACSEISHVALGEPATWLPGGSRMILMQLIRHSAGRFVYGGDRGLLVAQHRRALRQLAEVPTRPGPKFTFCHIIFPHPPYLFQRDGQPNWNIDQSDRAAYIDQVIYLNHEVTKAIDAILAQSTQRPIIVIQSDHGPGFSRPKPGSNSMEEFVQERVPILNAYLVPESVRQTLTPTITPVNTFRRVLTHELGFDYAPLPDRKFLVHRTLGATVLDVTDKIHDGIPEPGLLSSTAINQATAIAKKETTTPLK